MYKKEQELKDHYDKHYQAGITISSIGAIKKTFEELGVQLRGKVLDLGCGSGSACRVMKDNYDVEVMGVDYSKKRVELAKKKHPDIEFLNMDMHEFIETTNLIGHFDIITMFDVIEHLEDPVELIKNARSLLGTRGIIVARIPKNNVYIAHLQVYKDLDDLKAKLNPTFAKHLQETMLAMWTK